MKLEDIVWSKQHWQMLKVGGLWSVPALCGVMQKTPRGFSLIILMPFEALEGAAKQGYDVPATAEDLKAQQREAFSMMKEHFEAAGLDFDDPQGLLK